MTPRRRIAPGIHRVAAAGNAAAAVVLVLVLANGPALFGNGQGSRGRTAEGSLPTPGARGLVLVVVDGLRADTAADPAAMPRLSRLGREGGFGTARVEALVPSTVAAVVTLATGAVPAPSAFFEDFGARPSPDGGVFAAVAAGGGRSFVAGPRLWTDLFGRWVDAAAVSDPFRPDDRRTLDAGLAAVRSEAFRLVVVHLEDVDEAAHRGGTADPGHAAAVRRSDAAVGAVADALPPGFALVVTSDHGNLDAGGHAGPDLEVVRTPLVVSGPGLPAGPLPDLRQRDVPGLILGAIGPGRWAPPRNDAPAGVNPVWFGIGVLTAVGCGVRVWSGVGGGSDGRSPAFWLNLSVWLTLALSVLGFRGLALACASAALAATALRTPAGPARGPALGLALGGALGAARLAAAVWGWGWIPVSGAASLAATGLLPLAARPRPLVFSPEWWRPALTFAAVAGLGAGLGSSTLALVAVAAYASGRSLGGGRGGFSPAGLGTLSGLAPALWQGLLGTGLSLSTLDVRAAYGVVGLPGGFVLAALLVVGADALPVLAFLLGLAPGLARLGPEGLGRFAGALAAAVTGQAVPMALALGLSRPGGGSTPAALALDGLVRAACGVVYLFLALAALTLFARPPEEAVGADRRPGTRG